MRVADEPSEGHRRRQRGHGRDHGNPRAQRLAGPRRPVAIQLAAPEAGTRYHSTVSRAADMPGKVPADRDDRVDERVALQSAAVAPADPVRERGRRPARAPPSSTSASAVNRRRGSVTARSSEPEWSRPGPCDPRRSAGGLG